MQDTNNSSDKNPTDLFTKKSVAFGLIRQATKSKSNHENCEKGRSGGCKLVGLPLFVSRHSIKAFSQTRKWMKRIQQAEANLTAKEFLNTKNYSLADQTTRR